MAALNDNSLPLMPSTPAIGQNVTRKFVERIADTQRKQDMAAAWQAYLGKFPAPLKSEPGELDLNVTVNRVAPIVDTGVAWLVGATLGIEVDPAQPLLAPDADEIDEGNIVEGSLGDPDAQEDAIERAQHIPDADALNLGDDSDTDASIGAIGALDAALKTPEAAENPKVRAAQDYLDGCWGDEDERMTLLAKLATNGGICGHFFAKILPPDVQAGRQYPRLVVLDPQNVTMQTDPEDCDTVTSYTICYDGEADDGTVIEKRQVIARVNSGKSAADDTWSVTNYARGETGSDWTQLGPPRIWQHPWPPIGDGPNMPLPNQRWGQADVTPNLIALNKSVNFVSSNINAIGYSHGHPWVWASGTNAERIDATPGHIISLPHPDGKLDAVVAHGDIAGLMAFEADLRADMDEQSKVPAVATGRIAELPRGQQSGVMIRLLHAPLTFRTMFKQRTYGKFIREMNARMLALGGFGDGTDLGGVKTLLHWQDPLPVDDLQQAQAAFQWSQMGVSNDTLMAKGGFDPEVERRKNAEANARQLVGFSQGKDMPPSPPTDTPPAAPSDASTTPPDGQQGAMPMMDTTTTPTASTAPASASVKRKASKASSPSTRKAPPVNHPAAVAQRQPGVKRASRTTKATKAARTTQAQGGA